MQSNSGLPHSQEDTAELLRRAQEIEEQTRLMLQPYPEYAELVGAAEEAGIGRDATLQALRERMSLPVQAFEPGRRVFAKSADGHFYAATLESLNGRTARLRFVNGSDHVADVTDLKLFSLTPGQRVWFNSPSYGVWMQSEVVRYNPDSGSVTVNAWYQEEVVPLEKIRLNKERSAFQTPSFKFRDDVKMAAIGFAGLAAGTGLGFWIARLLGG